MNGHCGHLPRLNYGCKIECLHKYWWKTKVLPIWCLVISWYYWWCQKSFVRSLIQSGAFEDPLRTTWKNGVDQRDHRVVLSAGAFVA